MPRVAVVGARGFLGRHVRKALVAGGLDLLLLSRSEPSGHHSTWRRWTEDPSALQRLLRAGAIDVVVNCAGLTRGSVAELAAANIAPVTTLLKALDRTNVHLVQIGSAAEYGPGEVGKPIREDHHSPPLSDYGTSKLVSTGLVISAIERAKLTGVVLRVFNPVGAGVSPESLPGRAALQIRDALRGGSVHLGPLDATRDFVDVRDVADAVAAACVAGALAGRVLNVGSGRPATARELVRQLASVAGYSGPIVEDAAGSPRSEAIDWQVADISAAAAALGWTPRRSLRDAVTGLWEAG